MPFSCHKFIQNYTEKKRQSRFSNSPPSLTSFACLAFCHMMHVKFLCKKKNSKCHICFYIASHPFFFSICFTHIHTNTRRYNNNDKNFTCKPFTVAFYYAGKTSCIIVLKSKSNSNVLPTTHTIIK